MEFQHPIFRRMYSAPGCCEQFSNPCFVSMFWCVVENYKIQAVQSTSSTCVMSTPSLLTNRPRHEPSSVEVQHVLRVKPLSMLRCCEELIKDRTAAYLWLSRTIIFFWSILTVNLLTKRASPGQIIGPCVFVTNCNAANFKLQTDHLMWESSAHFSLNPLTSVCRHFTFSL